MFLSLTSGGLTAGSGGGGNLREIPISVFIEDVNRKKLISRNEMSAIEPEFICGVLLAIKLSFKITYLISFTTSEYSIERAESNITK